MCLVGGGIPLSEKNCELVGSTFYLKILIAKVRALLDLQVNNSFKAFFVTFRYPGVSVMASAQTGKVSIES